MHPIPSIAKCINGNLQISPNPGPNALSQAHLPARPYPLLAPPSTTTYSSRPYSCAGVGGGMYPGMPDINACVFSLWVAGLSGG